MFTGTEKLNLNAAKEDPEKFFCCNSNWPQCRFNFAKQHLVTEEFVFKIENLQDVEIFQDYFSPNKLEVRMNRQAINVTNHGILIERSQHYCKIKGFTASLAQLYSNSQLNEKLFMCKDLDIKKKMSQIEAHKKVLKFCQHIKK